MEKLKKLFGETSLSWKFIIIFSVVVAIIVATLNRIPALYDTSFSDPAVWLDLWIVLAVFVIVNCKDWKEAVAKCFVFFLISQPLIYLIEAIYTSVMGGGEFMSVFAGYMSNYYLGAGWMFRTILTIPGAFVAFQIKRKNILAAIILSVATAYMAGFGANYLIKAFAGTFPRHLLYSLFCIAAAYVLIFVILSEKKQRLIALILTTAGLAAGIIMYVAAQYSVPMISDYIKLDDGVKAVECVSSNTNVIEASLSVDADIVDIKTNAELGDAVITITDDKGAKHIYNIIVTSKGIEISEE